MQEPTSSSVKKIEANISEISAIPSTENPRGGRKAVRPLPCNDILPYVKPDPDATPEDGASSSSGRSSVSSNVPPLGAKVLRKMVEDKEVEVCFCDIGKQLRFGFRAGGAAVYVYPETKYPLDKLVVEEIEFPYAVLRRIDTQELRILVKLKGSDRHSVLDYPLRDFFTNFESLSIAFLEVINHYRRTQTEISNRIEKFEKLFNNSKEIWKNHAYNDANQLLPDEEIIKHLPEQYKNSNNPPKKIVEDFLNEMMDNNEHFYFFKLAKEFGKIMSQSSEACAAIKHIVEIFEKREKQFKSIDKKRIGEWCNDWTILFTS